MSTDVQWPLSTAEVKQKLCKQLVAKGHMSNKDFDQAERLQQNNGESFVCLLIKLGWVSEQAMQNILLELYTLDKIPSDQCKKLKALDIDVAVRFMRYHHLIPVSIDNNEEELTVAVTDPSNQLSLRSLAYTTGKSLKLLIGLQSEIDAAIECFYGEGRSAMGQIAGDIDNDEMDIGDIDEEQLRDLASEAPVIRFVNLIIQQASDAGASDIHIEPFNKQLQIRYRVDGVLIDVESPPIHYTAAIISRIKIMAKLNIAERRLPQDGRISIRIQGKSLDLRVSSLPTLHGECVVLRLLDRENLALDFDILEFSKPILQDFLPVLNNPNGIILVTGPTGSGKTTTLYTALSLLNKPSVKIISVEDPVEYELEGINQLNVNTSIGMDFATSLRSIVRQDPDVIMIGEMRDIETAGISIQSALTGHLVLSTLHTNDAASGITRLLDMGVENYLLISTINGILAQRLVRKLCQHCKAPYQMHSQKLRTINIHETINVKNATFYKAVGCDQCQQTGYEGRSMIVEWLTISDNIRDMIMQQESAGVIKQQAVSEGMVTLYQDGIGKAIAGVTSVEEVLRVVAG